MAQIFKAKTLVANSGRFAYEVSAPNLIYNTGDQSISGTKTFDLFPIVSGNKLITGVDLTSYATNINLYATGSTLNNKINSLSGYVNSQDVIFSGQTASTGSRLDNKINSLSGYVDSKSITLPSTIVYTTGNQTISGNKNFVENVVFGDQNQDDLLVISGNEISFGVYPTINGTGIVYNQGDQIISGNKTFDVFPVVSGNKLITGVNLSSYATNVNLFTTGSILDEKINSLSGYANSQNIILSGQIASSGSNLYNSILSLSGLFTGYTGSLDANFATDIQLFTTGSVLDNKINALSGYVSGISLGGLLPNSIVYITGNQTISGNKTFLNNVNISGTGNFNNVKVSSIDKLFLSGIDIVVTGNSSINIYNAIYISGNPVLTGVIPTAEIITNVVYTTGDQTISGNKTFDVAPIVSGNKLITGLDLSSYATNANLYATGSTLDNKINSLSGYVNAQSTSGQVFNTGSILDNKINSLSGYVNSQDIVFSGQIASTGSNLYNSILSLSGLFTGYTGSLDATFASDAQLFATGSTLDNKINSLSGYVNSQDVIFSGQTFNTGSRLDSKINSLSGYVDFRDILFSGQISLTGSNLNDKINSLSGLFATYTGNLDVTFATDAQLFNTGSTLDNKINSLSGYVNYQDTIFSGQTFNTGSRLDNKINSLSGYVDSKDVILSGQIASTGSSLYNSIISLSGYVNSQSTSGQVFNTGSTLDNKINSLSGYVNSQDIVFSGQTFNTGSRLDNKINSLSGYVDSKSIILPSTIVYTTGNQTISGNKNFVENVTFGDQAQDDLLVISGNEISFGIYPTVNGTGIVYTQGDQAISGVKTFFNPIKFHITGNLEDPYMPTISGTRMYDTITRLDISSYQTKLKSMAGDSITIGDEEGRLDINTVADTTTFNLGYVHNVSSNLSYNITSPSINLYGQVNGQTGTFQKLYASNLVYNTGNQTISGVKTFANNLEVQGTGIFNALDLSNISEFNFSGTNINLINGNVNISGGTLYISGNAVSTGVNLNAYATAANLFATGSTLDNKINSLSGYVNAQSTSGQVFNTGSTLDNKINALSGYVNSQDNIFSGQAFNTGSRLDNKVNSLSGYINSQDIIFSGQTASTGSILDNKINSLSGSAVLTYGNQNIYGIKYFYSGVVITGDGSTNGGYTLIAKNSQGTNGLQFTPAQEGGAGNLYFNAGTTSRLYNVGDSTLEFFLNSNQYRVANSFVIGNGSDIPDHTVSVINRYGYFGIGSGFSNPLERFHVSGGNLRVDGKILLSGNPVLTGVDLSSYATVANLYATGSTLDNKINSLSSDTIVYTTGFQTISGGKVFRGNQVFRGNVSIYSGLAFVKSQADLTDVDLNVLNRPYSNSYISIGSDTSKIGASINAPYREVKIWETGGYITDWLYKMARFGPLATILSEDSFSKVGIGTLFPTEKVHISGGNLKVDGGIYFSGNLVLTGVDLTSYATVANLFSTGSNLDNKINSLSGLFTSYTGNLDTNFATDAQLFTTGSTLDNKINNLSGYVNSQNILFSGQIASTGSRLDNKINALSGVSVLTFGDQTIYGNKNFLNNIGVSGTGVFNAIDLNNVDILSISGVDVSIVNGNVSLTNRPTVNGTGVLLIGEASSAISISGNNFVYTTGDQLISGNKIFLNNINVSGTGNFNNVKVSSIDKLFLSGIDMVVTGNSSINVYNDIYISGNRVLTGVIPTAQTITNVVYTTGNQLISGDKTFLNNVNISGTGNFNNVKVSSIDKLFLSGIDIVVTGNSSINIYNDIYISGNKVLTGVIPTSQTISNVVYTTGDQVISGNKTFSAPHYDPGEPSSLGISIYPSGQGSIAGPLIKSNDTLTIAGFNTNQKIHFDDESVYIKAGGSLPNIEVSYLGSIFLNASGLINLDGQTVGKTGTFQKLYADNLVYNTGNQTISGVKTFAETGSFNTLQITNKKLSSYNYINSNFTFGDAHINIVNSSNNVIGTLPSSVTSGINYYVKNLNTGVLLITGSNERTIDGFSNINLYKNESLQLLGVNNIGYTGWISLSVSVGVS